MSISVGPNWWCLSSVDRYYVNIDDEHPQLAEVQSHAGSIAVYITNQPTQQTHTANPHIGWQQTCPMYKQNMLNSSHDKAL